MRKTIFYTSTYRKSRGYIHPSKITQCLQKKDEVNINIYWGIEGIGASDWWTVLGGQKVREYIRLSILRRIIHGLLTQVRSRGYCLLLRTAIQEEKEIC